MATLNKDFKVKHGLVVEGSTATVNTYDILTKKQDDQDYIVGLIGGTSTSQNTANTVVKRDGNGDFAAGEITADLVGNVLGDLTGDVTGQVSDISNHNTDDLVEGTNKYYSDSLVDNHLSGGTGITYSSGSISANIGTGLHVAAGDIEIDRTEVDTWYDAAGSASSAQTAAENTAQGYANTAEQNANSYTNTALEDYTTTANLDSTVDGYGYLKSADLTGYATETYVNNEISALVDSAPDLLNTLGELATALQENPEVISDLQNIAAGKQDALTTGDGIYIDQNDVITARIDGSGGLKFNFAEMAIDRSIVNGWYDASGSAQDVQDNLDSHVNSNSEVHGVMGDVVGTYDTQTLTNKTIDGQNNTLSNIGNASLSNSAITVNGYATDLGNSVTLDTDDIAEGSAQYFTANRAKDAVGNMLGGTQENISVTYDPITKNLSFVAENGVADSTTADLAEDPNGNGSSATLYFTDARAVSALEAVVPNFTAVEVNSVAKQVAASTEVATASEATAYSWVAADYRSAEFLVKVAYGSHTEISKVMLTLDSSNNIAITEYAVVGTNGSASTISADIVPMLGIDNVALKVTTANNNSTVTVMGTLLA